MNIQFLSISHIYVVETLVLWSPNAKCVHISKSPYSDVKGEKTKPMCHLLCWFKGLLDKNETPLFKEFSSIRIFPWKFFLKKISDRIVARRPNCLPHYPHPHLWVNLTGGKFCGKFSTEFYSCEIYSRMMRMRIMRKIVWAPCNNSIRYLYLFFF